MPVPINSSTFYTLPPKEVYFRSIRKVLVKKPGSPSYPFIPKTVGVLQPPVLHPIQMDASLQNLTPPAKSNLPQTFEDLNQQGLCQTDCLSDTDTDLSAAYTHESDRDSNTSSTSDATVFETLGQIKKDCRAADQKNILIKVMRNGKEIDVITTLNENFKYGFNLDKSSNCVTRFAENPIPGICVGDQILDVQTHDATVFETLGQIKKDCRAADQKKILIKVMRTGKEINVITKLNENFKYGFNLDKSSNCVTRFAENPIPGICVGDQILEVQTHAEGSVSNTSSTFDATVFETLEQIKKDCRAADQKNILIKVMRNGKKIKVITKLNENFKYGFYIRDKSSNCVTRFAENPIPGICVGDQILSGEMRPLPLDPIPE